MYIENIDPVLVEIGLLAIRWYGLMFAVAVFTGFYYMRKNGPALGFDEDFIFTLFIIICRCINSFKIR